MLFRELYIPLHLENNIANYVCMEQTKKRKSQKNVTLRDITYEQLHAYCQEHQIKHSEFVEIALHTFLHMHGNPKDISKNIVKEHCLQDKMMEDLMKTMLKSNRLQKKILAIHSAPSGEELSEEITPSMESIEIRDILAKVQKKEEITALEAGILIANGFCPKCGAQLKKGSFTNKNNATVDLIQCPDWQNCGFQIRGMSGTSLEKIVCSEK